MKELARFDDSLSKFIDLISVAWNNETVSKNAFLRDALGRLTFILIHGEHDGIARAALAAVAVDALGNYVDDHGFSIATPDELFDESLKDENIGWKIKMKTERFEGVVRLIDRRVVGADWLRQPSKNTDGPTRIVFSSLKGGVGRSTALCVLAAHLAANGKRVLAIDMDLEAPGLGNMLLKQETLPEFGLLDFLVESGLNPINDEFFIDMIGHSWLGGGSGIVDIIPALGRRSVTNPVNVLAKIARAYLEQPSSDGTNTTITDRLLNLLSYFSSRNDYDLILIDARAGLHETTAAAMLGLGAEVLLFGLDQPQTFAGYEILFAHLATLPGEDWKERLHFVQAKAPQEDQAAKDDFASKMQELMNSYLWPTNITIVRELSLEDLREVFEIDWEDEANEIIVDQDLEDYDTITAITESSEYQMFDPKNRPESLNESVYGSTFGPFIRNVELLIAENSIKGLDVDE
jgi:Mrp family chromosome partitioning ATPase